MKNVKLVLTVALSLMLVSGVSAQESNTLSLKENMKQSGNILKKISSSVNDSSKNQENAVSVAKIIDYFQTSKTQSPDSVRNGSLPDYQNLIEQEIQNLKNLQEAFLKNDNVSALSIIQKINIIKKEGHDKYK